MSNTPEPITVIILCWNRPLYLWACLDSLYRYTRHPARFILIDNHSDDPGVRQVIEGFQRRDMFFAVEWGETNSPTRGWEAMYKYREYLGDYFVYIEGDVAVFDTSPCWLTRMSLVMRGKPNMAMLGSYVDTRDFIDLAEARRQAPHLTEDQIRPLIKQDSPERELAPTPPAPPIVMIEPPFNPPDRLVALRTSLLDKIQMGYDSFMYEQIKAAGLGAAIVRPACVIATCRC